jgi:uncharacterized SAM-binding protein YcdF (DUF218 family)
VYDFVSYGFLAPPSIFILLCLVGGLLALVWRRTGLAIVLISSIALYVAAMPAFSSYMLQKAESGLPDSPDLRGAQAIVVLGGDMRLGDGAQTPDTLGPLTRERLVFAAVAHRRLGLPVAVTGGPGVKAHVSLGALMKRELEDTFAVPVRWAEEKSNTTWENAMDTAPLLKADHISSVILVSQAWHLPRAIWAFERAGLHALPWPAPPTVVQADTIDEFLPSAAALQDTFRGVHELVGSFYYPLRH